MKRSFYIILLILAFTTISCNKNHRPKEMTTDSTEYIAPNFTFLQGNFTCSVHNMQLNGQLRMHSDSLIWINLNKIIELGRLQLTPDSVFLYTKFNNSYFCGTYQQVSQYFNFQTNFTTLQNLFVSTLQADSTTVHIPIQSNIINTHLILDFHRIDYPNQLRFPFHIPSNAKPLSIPIIQ